LTGRKRGKALRRVARLEDSLDWSERVAEELSLSKTPSMRLEDSVEQAQA
jgi:hypothetical protein